MHRTRRFLRLNLQLLLLLVIVFLSSPAWTQDQSSPPAQPGQADQVPQAQQSVPTNSCATAEAATADARAAFDAAVTEASRAQVADIAAGQARRRAGAEFDAAVLAGSDGTDLATANKRLAYARVELAAAEPLERSAALARAAAGRRQTRAEKYYLKCLLRERARCPLKPSADAQQTPPQPPQTIPAPEAPCMQAAGACTKERADFDAAVAAQNEARANLDKAMDAADNAKVELQASTEDLAYSKNPDEANTRLHNDQVNAKVTDAAVQSALDAEIESGTRLNAAQVNLTECLTRAATKCQPKPEVAQSQPPPSNTPPQNAPVLYPDDVEKTPTPSAACAQAFDAYQQAGVEYIDAERISNEWYNTLAMARTTVEATKQDLSRNLGVFIRDPYAAGVYARYIDVLLSLKQQTDQIELIEPNLLDATRRLEVAGANLEKSGASRDWACRPNPSEAKSRPPVPSDAEHSWGFPQETHLPPQSFEFTRGTPAKEGYLRGRLTVRPFCGNNKTGIYCDCFKGASREGQIYEITTLEGPPGEKLDFGNFYPEHDVVAMRAVFDTGTVTSLSQSDVFDLQANAPRGRKKSCSGSRSIFLSTIRNTLLNGRWAVLRLPLRKSKV